MALPCHLHPTGEEALEPPMLSQLRICIRQLRFGILYGRVYDDQKGCGGTDGGAVAAALPAGAMAAKKASIRFPAKLGLMVEGDAVTLKPKLKNVKLADVTWATSDGSVVSLSGNVATAVSVGRALVTATGGGATAKLGVVVLPKAIALGGGREADPAPGRRRALQGEEQEGGHGQQEGRRQGREGRRDEADGEVRQAEGGHPRDRGGGAGAPQGSAAAELDCANQTDQIVLVDYTGGSKAVLSLHEKVDGVWTEVLSCDAYVGKNGIGKTKEGDKKTPEGTYNLTTPFGIKDDPGAQMPYTKVTKYHYWCGDSSSEYYNQLVDERKVDRKHTSSDEYLIKYKGVYNYCMFIDYNAEGTPHKGSCIFLHCTGQEQVHRRLRGRAGKDDEADRLLGPRRGEDRDTGEGAVRTLGISPLARDAGRGRLCDAPFW